MNRRKFIESAGLLSTLPFIPMGIVPSFETNSFKIGLQLYTVRDAMAKDPVETLKSLQRMGYKDFESYGYDAVNKSYYGFSATEFRSILDDLNLTTSSGHYGVNNLLEASDDKVNKYVDSCIEGALALEDSYIVFPILDQKYHSPAGYKLLVKKLNHIGKRIHHAGLGFAYHNFGYDFDTYDNRFGLDWVIEETNPEWVSLEVDFYWVMHAGKISPKELIKKAPGRFKLWHIKDMHKQSRDYTELGNGSIDYTSVLPSTEMAGMENFFIEQGGNFANNSMASVEQSINYFKKNIKELK